MNNMIELSGEKLVIRINEKGAELSNIISRKNCTEYIWSADPQYWNRHSPVLFPIVGSVWDGFYCIDGKEYKLPQHGFARDMIFDVIEKNDTKVVFQLTDNESTKNVYPYPFILKIGYELKGNSIEVSWTVENKSDQSIYFQIGAHPGFFYPDFNEDEKLKGYLLIDTHSFSYTLLGEKGCISENDKKMMNLDKGLFPIMSDTFDNQAMIIENKQMSKISLLDKQKNKYLTLTFDAPVVGLWSPPQKNAPFICIEPWYGRCDYVGYTNDFRNKDWMNKLEPNCVFEASYKIEIDNL